MPLFIYYFLYSFHISILCTYFLRLCYTMRDGVNMNNVERKKLLVMPSEIMNLPDLTCYVKLAGNFPIIKLTMQLQNLNTAFVCEYKLLKKLKLVEY
ncbi:type IV secretion system DNA-binding domain-containing protein [Orientia tsutsugamushi]|uniref:type IV secretion system DNA-binding domain-containing protein n=1 Tax=Orientia tsutsugamushi TaxID=784 RepID=UPI001E3D6756|nr:type IV secretion system DNA-binding domain-containing protein [Orientia tsutsugamushi]